LQPYRFLVIEDPTMRRELLPHTWGQKQVVDASHFVVLAGRTQVTEAEIDTFLHLTATTRGMEVAKLAGYRGMMTGSLLSEGFQPKVPHWAECQTYLALGTLLSAAALLRVDACPIEGFLPAEYDRLLGLTAQGLTATVCCALGYRAGSDKHATAPKVRHPKSSLVQRV
jgi:nitroreductase